MFADHPDSLTGFDVDSIPGALLAPLLERERTARRWPGRLEDPTAQLLLGRLRGLAQRTAGQRAGVGAGEAAIALPGEELLVTGSAAQFADLCCLGLTRAADAAVRDFVDEHPEAVVLELGAGLSTALWRAAPERARWCAVDRPETIALRRRLLPTHPRVHGVGAALTDPAWPRAVAETVGIRPGEPVLVLAGGALPGLSREQVRTLMRGIVARFPGAQAVFEVASQEGARHVRETLGRLDGRPAPGAKHLQTEVPAWGEGARILSARSPLQGLEPPAGLTLGTTARARLARATGAARLVRVHLGTPAEAD